MASRMDRYSKGQERSKKNQSLYDEINALGNYSNIEGVLDISNANEIDINNIKELIANSERLNTKESIKKVNPIIKEEKEVEEKTYDIMDVLNKAKTTHSDKDYRHRNLKKQQYEVLKKLKKEHPEDEQIDELLNTLVLGGSISDDLGIFDELKSNTMVGEEASAIKKVLDEAKEIEQREETDNVNVESVSKSRFDDLDKSFYTASFNFSDKDFEDLRSIDKALKKNNKLIRLLIITFSVLIAVVLLIVVAKLIF